MEPLNIGHIGTDHFVHYREVVLLRGNNYNPFLVPLSESIGELSFNEGDLLMLKTRVGAEWLRGKLVSGQEGIFPRSFVEIVVSVCV